MAVKTYNNVVRDFVSMADAMNRARNAQTYDYAHNGGHNGNDQGEGRERIARLPIDVRANDDAFFIKANLSARSPSTCP